MIKSLKQKEFNNNKIGKSISALQTLMPYIRPYRWRLFGAAFALLMITIAMLSLGRGLAFIVDEGLAGNNPAFLSVSIILTIAIALILAIGSYFRANLINQIGESVIADIRVKLFSHILSQSTTWFESAKSGDILSRLTVDTSICLLYTSPSPRD